MGVPSIFAGEILRSLPLFFLGSIGTVWNLALPFFFSVRAGYQTLRLVTSTRNYHPPPRAGLPMDLRG